MLVGLFGICIAAVCKFARYMSDWDASMCCTICRQRVLGKDPDFPKARVIKRQNP